MDDSSILAIKAQLERKARVKGLVEGYAFLADPKEAVLVATSKPEGCVTSEKQLSDESNAVNISQQIPVVSRNITVPARIAFELDEDPKLDLEALANVALNFRDFLLSLAPHGSSMRAPLLALAMSGHKHISTDFLASFANVTSAPLSLSRSHTSYEYFGFLNFLRLHCPPPSGVTILSGESFRLRKSRFWTWVDFKLSYANGALPEIDRQLYNRSALSILDSTPSAAVPTHFTQSKRNHKRGQQELKQAHDYNMLTHDKFKKKQKTLKVTECSKCGVVMTDDSITAHRKPGARGAHKCPPQCSKCHSVHQRNVTCPLIRQTSKVPAQSVNESSTPAQSEDTMLLTPELGREKELAAFSKMFTVCLLETSSFNACTNCTGVCSLRAAAHAGTLSRLPKRLTNNLRIYHAILYTKEIFDTSRVMVTLWLTKRPPVPYRKKWYDNFSLGVLQCLFGRGHTLPQLHRNALSVVREAKSIRPPGPDEFLHAIDKQFWCVAHGASYWPRCPHCREADKVLASFSKLQKKPNLSEPEAKELKKLAKRVDQFALHTMVKKSHSSLLPKLRRELKSGGEKAVLIIDFTKFAMGNENRAIDLVFVCFYWNVTAQCVEWEYIDVVCEGSEEVKNNFAYVHEAFLKACERIQKIVAEKANSTLRGVDIFSDGGPNHFKISSTIAFFSTLKAKYNLIRLRWFFFASYHGSSLCDGHAAVIHHVLNAVAFNEDKAWHTVDELIAAIKERCSRACPIKLDRVPTALELPLSFEVKTLEGIRISVHILALVFALAHPQMWVARAFSISLRKFIETLAVTIIILICNINHDFKKKSIMNYEFLYSSDLLALKVILV
eukprot:g72972.t1